MHQPMGPKGWAQGKKECTPRKIRVDTFLSVGQIMLHNKRAFVLLKEPKHGSAFSLGWTNVGPCSPVAPSLTGNNSKLSKALVCLNPE